MKIILNPNTSVREVKKEFNILFPYLKLEFFRERHGTAKGSHAEDRFHSSTLLKEINPRIQPLILEIEPSDTVAYFEQFFQNELGMPVQVFRKAGDTWLETIQTDHLTLLKQNAMGFESGRRVSFNVFTLFL
jgi:hypothetical protein